MNRFGSVVQHLSFMVNPQDQVRLLAEYLKTTPEADRQAAISFLLTSPRKTRVQLKKLREAIEQKVDPGLFALSHAFVGDMAETMALLWQPATRPNVPVSPSGFAERLSSTGPLGLATMIQQTLDSCDPHGRLAVIRLVTASFRRPVPIDIVELAMKECGIAIPVTPATSSTPAHQPDLFGTETLQVDEPGCVEAALMYVEGTRARQSRLLCTFGVWSGHAIIPLARIEAGIFQEQIAGFAKAHTLRRFGPSSEVEHSVTVALVATLEFQGIDISRRHKAGVSLKAPRLVAMHAGVSASDASNIEDVTSRLLTPHDHG